MCLVCALILKKLLHKGLVSEGNIQMCKQEIKKETEQFESDMIQNLSEDQLQSILGGRINHC
jgi:hypothetical protein